MLFLIPATTLGFSSPTPRCWYCEKELRDVAVAHTNLKPQGGPMKIRTDLVGPPPRVEFKNPKDPWNPPVAEPHISPESGNS